MQNQDDKLKKEHAAADQADYEERVKRRTKLFLKDWEQGKIRIPAESIPRYKLMIESIRYDESGDPIPDTVHGIIRTVAMASEHMFTSDEASKITPAWIQTNVFSLIEDFVQRILSIPGANEQTPQTIADTLIEDERFVHDYLPVLGEYRDSIADFWERTEWALDHHYQQSTFSKALFVGDVFPADAITTCCKTCLFFDQILLPDPISRVLIEIGEQLPAKKTLHQMIKHCISAYRLKDLIFADTDVPPVALVPGSLLASGESGQSRYLMRVSRLDAIEHINRSFGTSFESLDDFVVWSKKYDDDRILELIQNPDQLLTTYDGNTEIRRAISENMDFYSQNLVMPPGYKLRPHSLIAMMSAGRMGQANDALIRSGNYRAEPVYSVQASHQWLRWKMDLDNVRDGAGTTADWKSIAASQLAFNSQTNVDFLSGLTPAGLLRARESEGLESLRAELSEALASFEDDFANGDRAAEIALKKLSELVQVYNQEIANLSKSKRKTSRDFFSSAVPGMISMCASLAGNPYLTRSAITLGALASGPGLLATWKEARVNAKKQGELKRSPIGMLFS